MIKNNYIEYPYFGDSFTIKEDCINCEKEAILKYSDLQIELDKAKKYIAMLEKANDIAQQLNQALREDNEQLRTRLNNSIEME